MNNSDQEMGKTIAQIFRDRYVIPLYQRNFAWRTDEIQQLLQDVYDAYKLYKQKNVGNYYIGSLVVIKRHNGDYEVIDGQQRLTVLSLIANLFNGKDKLSHSVLFYDSRPDVQEFFELLCGAKSDSAMALTAPTLFYLKAAYEFLQSAKVMNGSDEEVFYKVQGVADYFLHHVVLVRNEMPEDTDVAAYFEIMNNRGEQLQKHEIVKARMMDKIKVKRPDGAEVHDTVRQSLFAQIWDACSQMDVPIQRLFSAGNRRQFFGDRYDGFACNINNGSSSSATASGETPDSLKDILDGKAQAVDSNEKRDEEAMETDVYSYASIIDFPNFLMHILRLYLDKIVNVPKESVNVPLNEKHLLSAYQQQINNIDPMEFVKLLLFCRTVFDRFIVKTTEDTSDQEDGRKWVLLKPTKYENSNWKYTSSFEGEKGKQLVVALSMLQVTFRTRIYKTWLYETLEWFHKKCWQNGNLAAVSADAYLGFLHGRMLVYYNKQKYLIPRIPDGEIPSKTNSFSLGTATPHFLLNFIDYLYWCDWRRNKEKYEKYGRFRKLEDFSFKYWNSVEHHRAQNKAEGCQYIDNLGNLCLVSKSSNSRLSDRDVKEKVDVYGKGNLGFNRQIIYAETIEANWTWGDAQIFSHYNEIVALLDSRQSILPADSNFTETGCRRVDLTNDMDALGNFIEQHFFDLNLPNGYSVVVRKGDDAESPTEWCGRYFDICCDDDVVKAWVGWLYGVGAYKNSPRFVIQVKKEKFSEFPGSSASEWYPDTFWKIWMNKDIANSLDDMDAVANKFKKEIEVLCTHM